jgi:hypothetical protein
MDACFISLYVHRHIHAQIKICLQGHMCKCILTHKTDARMHLQDSFALRRPSQCVGVTSLLAIFYLAGSDVVTWVYVIALVYCIGAYCCIWIRDLRTVSVRNLFLALTFVCVFLCIMRILCTDGLVTGMKSCAGDWDGFIGMWWETIPSQK